MKYRLTIFWFFLMFFLAPVSSAEKVWCQVNEGISDLDIRSISVFAKDSNFICAASSKQVYLSKDSGTFWKSFFSLESETGQINFLKYDLFNPDIIYVATTEGLFITRNFGEDWQRIFRKANRYANDVRWAAQDFLNPRKLYIGTSFGLYLSSDSGSSWKKVKGGLTDTPVFSIAVHPNNSQVLYLANTYGLFKSIDRAKTWKRIFVTSQRMIDEEDVEEINQISQEQNLINCVIVDNRDSKRIIVGTARGLFISRNAGETWSKLPAQGLKSDYINFILTDKKGSLYAATKEGIFEFLESSGLWRNIYRGLTASNVHTLAVSEKGNNLFAGTDRGIFKATNPENISEDNNGKKTLANRSRRLDGILRNIALKEPSIQQVQEDALRYGEVIHPEQIESLRRNARIKALLPDVSVDYDKSVNYDSGSDRYYIGPRDWGFSLSWDVGDLIFNEQLRLIDSNARLAVQLRDDILNEVTRLYYERRRLQIELIMVPPATAKERLTKVLRLEELTANIDALTGGCFSQQLKRKKAR